MRKINLSDSNIVREKILSGITKMNDLISQTLGPAGRSIIIERGLGEPLIVDDGRRVAENIKLDDPIEQLAVRVCYSVTRKTDEKVGDGTTTSLILAHALLKDVFENHIGFGVDSNKNVFDIDNQIKKDKEEILKELDKRSREVKTEKDLKNIANVIVNDKRLGDAIGGMYHKLGKEGHITHEFNHIGEEIETDLVPGYRFTGGYASPWMITNELRKECVLSDINVLVVKKKMTDFSEIMGICNQVANSSGKRNMVIIATGFDQSFLTQAYRNVKKPVPFLVLCVRAPGRGKEAFKDMAVFTGGKYFEENDDLKNIDRSDLGYVNKIEVSEDITVLIGGKGKPADLKKRTAEINAEININPLPQFKKDRMERMSALNKGVGLIKIGAPTDEERNWWKYKIEDGIQGTRHAFQSGIIKGGGLAFKEISEKLSKSNILKKSLFLLFSLF